jgi:hypothetical protein
MAAYHWSRGRAAGIRQRAAVAGRPDAVTADLQWRGMEAGQHARGRNQPGNSRNSRYLRRWLVARRGFFAAMALKG